MESGFKKNGRTRAEYANHIDAIDSFIVLIARNEYNASILTLHQDFIEDQAKEVFASGEIQQTTE